MEEEELFENGYILVCKVCGQSSDRKCLHSSKGQNLIRVWDENYVVKHIEYFINMAKVLEGI